MACDTCHVVPSAVDSPGHLDGNGRAEVTFSALALLDNHQPSYAPATQSCTDTYCHRAAQPDWTAPRSSSDACGSCHGLPPPSPHPQVDNCSLCHGEVVDSSRHFIAPERHVNGQVDLSYTCSSCHGSASSPAPPVDLSGNSSVTALGVGAHQAHLSGGTFGRPVPCGECHVVPSNVDSPGHIDGDGTAEVVFSGAASAEAHSPSWDRASATCSDTYCHGPDSPGSVSPVWTSESTTLDCTSCHGMPPPAPHPQFSQCYLCHSDVDASPNISDPSLHINGQVDF